LGYGIAIRAEDNWNGVRCCHSSMHRLEPTGRNKDIHIVGDKLIRQDRQSIQLTLRPSIFDCDRAAFSETVFGEALTNGG
jgi:hypothetical protein